MVNKHHDFLVHYYESVSFNEKIGIIMEYFKDGDLASFIREGNRMLDEKVGNFFW
jgi:hypothetical protein